MALVCLWYLIVTFPCHTYCLLNALILLEIMIFEALLIISSSLICCIFAKLNMHRHFSDLYYANAAYKHGNTIYNE